MDDANPRYVAKLEQELAEARDEIKQHDLWREYAEGEISRLTEDRDALKNELQGTGGIAACLRLNASLTRRLEKSRESGCWCDESGQPCKGCEIKQERNEYNEMAELADARRFQVGEERDALAAKMIEVVRWWNEDDNTDFDLGADPQLFLAARDAEQRKAGAVAGIRHAVQRAYHANVIGQDSRADLSGIADEIERGEVTV